jgi:hypothetical protein
MTSFAPAAALPAVDPPDPSKHVNYTLGMVLGVEDFTQEFAYLSGRDRWLARDLIGYGTVAGLPVRVQRDGADVRVHVGAGTAVSPCGQLICVDAEQCASIDAWLLEHADELRDHPARAPLPVYVTLCYRAALADDVPIPGEPCRSEDELMEPSRVQDCFRLELRLDPPPQCEEDAVGGFVAWLRAVELTDDARRALGPDEFLDALRAAASAVDERDAAPCPSGFAAGRPARAVAIPRAEACDFVRAASRVWATELRPRLRWPAHAVEDDCGCGGACEGPCRGAGHPGGCDDDGCEDAVLLAELRLPVASPPGQPLRLDGTAWELDETRRPHLLHLRVLQELLACGVLAEGGAGVPGPPGRDGRDGEPGRDGRDGRDGADGRPGRDGRDGAPGRDGRDGRPGRDGINGIDGSPGTPGPSTLIAGGEFLFRDVQVGDEIETVFSFPPDDLRAIFLGIDYYRLEWSGFDETRDYLVVGTPLVEPYDGPHTFEVIRFAKPDEAPDEFRKGIVVRLLAVRPAMKPPRLPGLDNPGEFDVREARGFMVEISDVTELTR